MLNATRSALQRADLRRRLRGEGHLPGHGDDALPPAPRAPVRAARRDARRTPARRARGVGASGPARARGDRRRARAVGRVRALRRRRAVLEHRRSRACATAPTWSVEGYDFAPTFSIWTTIEECLNPPLIWERERGFYTTAPFSEPETFEFPEGIGAGRMRQRRARGGRADPALGASASASPSSTASGRSSSTCSKTIAQTRPGLDRAGLGARRGGRSARRRRRRAARPGDARRADERAHLRRHMGARAPASDGQPRSTYLYHVVDNEHDDARVRQPGGRLADGDQPGRRARAARPRRAGREPACSGPRRSRRCPSSSCSPSSARRTASAGAAGLSAAAAPGTARSRARVVRLRHSRARASHLGAAEIDRRVGSARARLVASSSPGGAVSVLREKNSRKNGLEMSIRIHAEDHPADRRTTAAA